MKDILEITVAQMSKKDFKKRLAVVNIDANLYVHPKNAQSAQRKDNVTCKSDCDFVLYSGSIEKLEATLVGFTLSKRNTDKSKKNIAIKEIKTSRGLLV